MPINGTSNRPTVNTTGTVSTPSTPSTPTTPHTQGTQERATGGAWVQGPRAAGNTAANAFGAKVGAAGKQSVLSKVAEHQKLLDQTGVGLYFGDHSSFHELKPAERQAWMKDHLKPGVTRSANELKQTSCIDWALSNVVSAYEAAGKGARGHEIARIVAANHGLGGVLCRELQKDGWTSLFWAKDSKNPDEPGSSDRQVHKGYIDMAVGQKKYWVSYPNEKMKVDDYVMDYSPSSDTTTPAKTDALDKLSKIPFAVGIAKGGMHCFTMHDGVVNEQHWTAEPDAQKDQIFQETKMKDWGWSSGLIMVPPGTWQKTTH